MQLLIQAVGTEGNAERLCALYSSIKMLKHSDDDLGGFLDGSKVPVVVVKGEGGQTIIVCCDIVEYVECESTFDRGQWLSVPRNVVLELLPDAKKFLKPFTR